MSALESPGIKWIDVVAFRKTLTVECFRIYFNLLLVTKSVSY